MRGEKDVVLTKRRDISIQGMEVKKGGITIKGDICRARVKLKRAYFGQPQSFTASKKRLLGTYKEQGKAESFGCQQEKKRNFADSPAKMRPYLGAFRQSYISPKV